MGIYYGTLIKGNNVLHTAWWYTNGKIQTIDQLEWRVSMFKGDGMFYLVNVTTKDEAALFQKLNMLLTKDLLTIDTL